MEHFKIYLYTNLIENDLLEERKVLITDSHSISSASTFNENFQISENGQTTLSFNIMEKLPNGKPNPFFDLVKPESIIGLHLPKREKNTENKDFTGAYYKMKVLERSPDIKEDNIQYSISCIDFPRAVYAKQAEGFEYENTGTLRELAEDILGKTRKNVIYHDLNRDISKIYNELVYIKAQEPKGFKYSLPYINYEQADMNIFKNGEPYAIFLNDEKMENGKRYDMQFDIVSSVFREAGRTHPVDIRFGIRGMTSDNKETFSSVTGKVINFEKALHIRFPFTFVDEPGKRTDRIELTINEITNPADGTKWPTGTGKFSLSFSGFKISKSRSVTEENLDTTALRINHLKNFEDFKNKEQGNNSYIKMTLSVSNSNLYASLVALATLFDAEVRFDYIENAFYFVSKKNREYKGYNLHPDINLNSISRPEDSTEFATILHLEGEGDIDGAMPSMPIEWRRFLAECVDKDFPTKEFFKHYNETSKYTDYIDTVYSYRDEKESGDERLHEIEEFAKHMDKIPNFESTLYDFSYFKNIGVLGKIGGVDYYQELMRTIYDDVRKINISLNVNTYRYYTIYSSYLTQLTQISFYVNLINSEEKLIYNAEQKLDPNNPTAPEKYTSSWVSYMNAIDSAKANISDYKEEINVIVGIGEEKNIDVSAGSFVYNSCMLFGYIDNENNGIQKLLDENASKINEKVIERNDNNEKIKELEDEIADPNTTTFMKESLAVELSGIRSKNDNIGKYLGIPNGNRGVYLIESGIYGDIKSRIRNKKIEINESFITNKTSLFTLLYDRENKHNLLNKKEKALEVLMDEYESFALEARYQNSDEVDAKGLLDQGLIAFTKLNRPKVSYNISSIHIGALEEYAYYRHPEIGDKVKLDEELYLTYQNNEETNQIVIVGYSENLREINSLQLTVETDDESDLLVKRMLEQTNFIQVGKTRSKSNYTLPVPNELREDVPSVEDAVEKLHDTDLSISNMFDRMIGE